jgi:hypothetical protein
MWEKDKQIIALYRECMQNFLAELKAGEDVDYESACLVEAERVQGYTFKAVTLYQADHPSKLSDKQQSYYTPRMPYF